MKAKITSIILLLGFVASAQTFFIKHSIDWKMAFDGPGHSYNASSSYNPEYLIGFEFEKSRVGMGFEDHDAIDYSKWFLEYDLKKNAGAFDFFAGLEFGVIWRSYDFRLSNYPVTVRETQASITAGANLEAQLKIIKGIHLSANLNVFTTEGGDSEKKEFFRWDLMGGLVFKIPYRL